MVFFGFTIGGALLSHSLRLHIEANSCNSWFNFSIEYSETGNGIIIVFELCKILLYLGMLSNCQDFWYNTSDNYFLRQEHSETPLDFDGSSSIIEDVDD